MLWAIAYSQPFPGIIFSKMIFKAVIFIQNSIVNLQILIYHFKIGRKGFIVFLYRMKYSLKLHKYFLLYFTETDKNWSYHIEHVEGSAVVVHENREQK